MYRVLIWLSGAGTLMALLFYLIQYGQEPAGAPGFIVKESLSPPIDAKQGDKFPEKAVLDITVHTIDELKVLLDRAEELVMSPQSPGNVASVVLVLHGPEVEFFSINNYEMYKSIVDQAARLDAFDVVDVRICRTMMEVKGIARDDIPAFIEQVPLGSAELGRLVGEGYVYF